MRGDQLARQWRIVRAIEASPSGLTVADIAKREEKGLRTIYRDLEALQAAGFPLYTERVEKANRWAFVDTFKFKIPAPFTLTELMSLYFYKDLVRVFKGTPFHDSIDSVFKKIQSTLPPQALRYMDQIQSVFHVGIKPYKDYAQFRNRKKIHSRERWAAKLGDGELGAGGDALGGGGGRSLGVPAR